jgi:hypothetical protein
MTNAPGRHCQNRVFEWTMTGALLGMGILMVIWPTAFSASKLQFLLDIINPKCLTYYFLTIGGLRAVALYRNGSWPVWGARMRVLCAMGSMAVWMQMGLSLLIMQTAIYAPPSPSVPLYAALVVAELYSTYRAAADVRYR